MDKNSVLNLWQGFELWDVKPSCVWKLIIPCFFLTVLLFFHTQNIECGGFIEIKFLTYKNLQHTDTHYRCCNTQLSTCRLPCKNIFNLCLGHGGNQPTDDKCKTGFYQSDVIDYDDITFPETLLDQRLAHGMKYSFNQWKVRYMLLTFKFTYPLTISCFFL